MAATLKLKVGPRSTLKMKVLPKFPANVLGQNGVDVTRTDGTYYITLDADEAAALLGLNDPTGVTAGTYGSATQVGQFTVNELGKLTSAANVTVTPAVGSITGLGTGVATWLATPSSANLAAAVTGETGTGALVFGTAPTLVTPTMTIGDSALSILDDGDNSKIFRFELSAISTATTRTWAVPDVNDTFVGLTATQNLTGKTLTAPIMTAPVLGTPASGTLTNCTLPVGGLTGLGTGVATFLATPTSANLLAAVTNETGTGALVFGTSPGFTTAANPVSNDGATLGTTSLKWSDLFLASGAVINFNSGAVTITHSLGSLAFDGGSNGYTFSHVVAPGNNDGAALGFGSQAWSDIFLASGAVVNFNNGDVTVTHSANTLSFGGASSGYNFDAAVTPSTNDSAALGTSSVSWADLFLASGGVINFNAGDVTITHSTNQITVAGGALAVPDDAYDATNWNGSLEVPTKNAVRDKIETISAGSSDFKLLTSGTVSSASSLDIVLTSYTAYRGIVFVLTNMKGATDGGQFCMRVSTDGGSSYDSSGYNWAGTFIIDSGTAFDVGSASDSSIQCSSVSAANDADHGLNLTIELLGQTNTVFWPKVSFRGYQINASDAGAYLVGGGARETAQDTDAVRFFFTSGNIASGDYAVYGLA